MVDLCISSNSIGQACNFEKDFDPTIPDVRLPTERFIKLLNRVYGMHKGSDTIMTKIYFRVGEYIKTEDKKYTLFSIDISSDMINKHQISELKELAAKMNMFIDFKFNSTILNIPLITD